MGESKGAMKPSEVIQCDCKHEAQDELHGKQNRVHNPNGKDEYVCTVCGKPKKRK